MISKKNYLKFSFYLFIHFFQLYVSFHIVTFFPHPQISINILLDQVSFQVIFQRCALFWLDARNNKDNGADDPRDTEHDERDNRALQRALLPLFAGAAALVPKVPALLGGVALPLDEDGEVCGLAHPGAVEAVPVEVQPLEADVLGRWDAGEGVPVEVDGDEVL